MPRTPPERSGFPIEQFGHGDMVQSLVAPGLKTDVPFQAQYQWLSTWGLEGASMRSVRVAQMVALFLSVMGRVPAAAPDRWLNGSRYFPPALDNDLPIDGLQGFVTCPQGRDLKQRAPAQRVRSAESP